MFSNSTFHFNSIVFNAACLALAPVKAAKAVKAVLHLHLRTAHLSRLSAISRERLRTIAPRHGARNLKENANAEVTMKPLSRSFDCNRAKSRRQVQKGVRHGARSLKDLR